MPSSSSSPVEDENIINAIHINVPQRLLVLPSVCGVAGLSLGFIKGSRAEGMRFLAENAHRPPTTVRGWYLYKKTKNYRMLWGGLRQGGREAVQLGAIGAGFAAAEEGMNRVGLAEAREAGAGVVTALARVMSGCRQGWMAEHATGGAARGSCRRVHEHAAAISRSGFGQTGRDGESGGG